MNNEIAEIVRNIMRLLVDGKFDDLVTITHGRRLTAFEMQQAIKDYGRRLVMPPESIYSQLIDMVFVEASAPSQWSIEMPLWTREEGQSDLSIELTVAQDEVAFDVQIDDIHVL